MAAERYTADFFKKNQDKGDETVTGKLLKHAKIKAVVESTILAGDSLQTASDIDDDDSVVDEIFNNEDRTIAKLYRKVVDKIIIHNQLEEWKVNNAISKMKEDIFQGHKKGFKRFSGIDFGRATNRCAYLRRYAICHTGLVKKAVWRFLLSKETLSDYAKSYICGLKELKVVSLGGGPGNDLVGFCCALQETSNQIRELDLKVVDLCQGWVSMFSTILKSARTANFGTLSELLKKTKITTGFMQADFNSDDVFDDENLSTVLGEADVVLMVKLTSFLTNEETEDLLQNVVNNMQCGAFLMFIDQPYDKELFQTISCLSPIYHHWLTYEMSFNPLKYHCPAISASQAHIAVFEKEEEISSDDDET